jgi:hypothetical protein
MAAPRFRFTQLHRNAEWLRGLEPSQIDLILAGARSCRSSPTDVGGPSSLLF